MSEQQLHCRLPPQLLVRISAYLRPSPVPLFIVDLMQGLKGSAALWRQLVRESAGVLIQLPASEGGGYNFSDFVESVLLGQVQGLGVYFQQFCKQLMATNSTLALNRYYVGNGGSPAFEMMAQFLICRNINWSLIPWPAPQDMCVHVYNVLEWCFANMDPVRENVFRCFYTYPIHTTTIMTIHTIDLCITYLLKKIEKDQGEEQSQKSKSHREHVEINIENWFDNVLQLLAHDAEYHKQRLYMYIRDIAQVQHSIEVYWQVLQMTDSKHSQLLHIFSQQFIRCLTKHLHNYNLMAGLHRLPHFRQLMQRDEFYYGLFRGGCRRLLGLMWQEQGVTERMCGALWKGKTVLQVAAGARGLTFNLVIMLWETGLFTQMPAIRNSKSRKIVAKYLGLELQQTQLS